MQAFREERPKDGAKRANPRKETNLWFPGPQRAECILRKRKQLAKEKWAQAMKLSPQRQSALQRTGEDLATRSPPPRTQASYSFTANT